MVRYRVLLVAGLAVLLAGNAWSDPTIVPVTDSPSESEYAVRVSPDGETLVMSYAPTNPAGYNQRRLAFYDADGSNRVLSAYTGQFGGGVASWSPDGSMLVFDKTRFGQSQGLYLINADGTGETRIYNSPSGYMPLWPDWSPDGDWIAFEQAPLSSTIGEIWRVKPDGSDAERLTTGGGRCARYSPDGSMIAFWRNPTGSDSYLCVMDADGSDVERVTPTGIRFAGDGGLSWSPDGTELVYDAYYPSTGARELRLIGVDGSDDRHLLDLQGHPGSPWVDWARDGSNRIYFTDASGDVFYIEYEPPDTTPPTVALSVEETSLSPANHKLVDVGLALAVGDDRDEDPAVSLTVTSNEADDGDGDGSTTGDVALVLGTGTIASAPPGNSIVIWSGAASELSAAFEALLLRAERSGNGDGRDYTITLTAGDAAGNATTAVTTVRVPHDKGK